MKRVITRGLGVAWLVCLIWLIRSGIVGDDDAATAAAVLLGLISVFGPMTTMLLNGTM